MQNIWWAHLKWKLKVLCRVLSELDVQFGFEHPFCAYHFGHASKMGYLKTHRKALLPESVLNKVAYLHPAALLHEEPRFRQFCVDFFFNYYEHLFIICLDIVIMTSIWYQLCQLWNFFACLDNFGSDHPKNKYREITCVWIFFLDKTFFSDETLFRLCSLQKQLCRCSSK